MLEYRRLTAREEFEEWLRRNGKNLAGQSTKNVADIAIADGQDIVIVRQWQTHRRFEEIEKPSRG